MAWHFLSCDWGSSSFRLHLLDAASNKVVATVRDNRGISDTYNTWKQTGLDETERISFYKNILQQYINKFNTNVTGLPILISGMASSSIGIKNIPYGNLPFDLSADQLSIAYLPKGLQFNHDLYIISGLRTNDDAMRGEETILFGCDTNNNDGIYIFPGTHSKHVLVKNNTAIDVNTYMTGEIFDLLCNKSMLAQSVEKSEDDSSGAGFYAGVQAGITGSFLNTIFHARTNVLFKKLQPHQNYHYLSGLLISTELKEISRESRVFIVSEDPLLHLYLKAAAILQLKNIIAVNAGDAFINAHLKLGKRLIN